MKMRVVKAFGIYSVGAIIEPHGMYREQLRQGGFIEPVPTERTAAQPEVALAAEPETASLPTPKRRGRPPRVPAN